MIAIIEFLSLVGYEAVLAAVMGAFRPMKMSTKKLYLFWALLPLALMTMFHGENVGNDTQAYLEAFTSAQSLTLKVALSSKRFEKGYTLFNYILARLFSNRQSVLIAEGCIVYLSLARWLNKWCKAPGLFVCLIVEMLKIDGWMSILRQSLALAVLLAAFDALVEKKLFRFVVIVLLAAQFHAVSYAFLLTYPMLWYFKEYQGNPLKKGWKFEKLMMIGTVGMFLFMWPMIMVLLKFFPKYLYYVSGVYMDGQVRVSVVLDIIVYVLLLLLPGWIKNKNRELAHNTAELSLYRMAYVNIAVLTLALQATIINRISGIFSIFAIAYFTEQTAQLKYDSNRKIVTILALVLFALYGAVITIYRTPAWQTTYPFEWWW